MKINVVCSMLFSPKEMSRLRLPSYFDTYRHYSTLHIKKSTAIQETDIFKRIYLTSYKFTVYKYV